MTGNPSLHKGIKISGIGAHVQNEVWMLLMFAREQVSPKLSREIYSAKKQCLIHKGTYTSDISCLLWIRPTVCGVSHSRTIHIVAPPDMSYHGQIEVSVRQLDPCCCWFHWGSSAQELPLRPRLWRMFPRTRTHHPPLFHSFLQLSYATSFLHLTFDLLSARQGERWPYGVVWAKGRRADNKVFKAQESGICTEQSPPDTEPLSLSCTCCT